MKMILKILALIFSLSIVIGYSVYRQKQARPPSNLTISESITTNITNPSSRTLNSSSKSYALAINNGGVIRPAGVRRVNGRVQLFDRAGTTDSGTINHTSSANNFQEEKIIQDTIGKFPLTPTSPTFFSTSKSGPIELDPSSIGVIINNVAQKFRIDTLDPKDQNYILNDIETSIQIPPTIAPTSKSAPPIIRPADLETPQEKLKTEAKQK